MWWCHLKKILAFFNQNLHANHFEANWTVWRKTDILSIWWTMECLYYHPFDADKIWHKVSDNQLLREALAQRTQGEKLQCKYPRSGGTTTFHESSFTSIPLFFEHCSWCLPVKAHAFQSRLSIHQLDINPCRMLHSRIYLNTIPGKNNTRIPESLQDTCVKIFVQTKSLTGTGSCCHTGCSHANRAVVSEKNISSTENNYKK